MRPESRQPVLRAQAWRMSAWDRWLRPLEGTILKRWASLLAAHRKIFLFRCWNS